MLVDGSAAGRGFSRRSACGAATCDIGGVSPSANPFAGAVQVAGIIDLAEAELLVSCGVDWLGFPLRLSVHREDLSESEARAIIARLPSSARAILITYLAEAAAIRDLAQFLGVAAVQIHGDIDPGEIAKLRAASPRLFVVKSLVVRPDNSAELDAVVERSRPHVDAFITDSFDPATGATGATGRTHDWTESARIVASCGRPVILAGGLTPANVADAVASVRPAAVDVHTGVEGADGRKRRDLVVAFVAAARRAFRAIDAR
jgi:phosphoribosylanthranilate isomerase